LSADYINNTKPKKSTTTRLAENSSKKQKKEEWTQEAVHLLIHEAVPKYTDSKGKINWTGINNEYYPTRGPMAARSKFSKFVQKQTLTKSSQPSSSATAISSSDTTTDNSSIRKNNLPEANEILNQIRTILNSQGLSNEQLLHLIQSEVHKTTYAGYKIKKHF
jgi:hypothetical protein